MTAGLNLMRSGARSQWKLARACFERRKPAIDRAAVLSTDWRRLSPVSTWMGNRVQVSDPVTQQANSAFHASGVGKWGPASAGKEKAGTVHSIRGWTWGVQAKLSDPLRTRAITERLRDVFTTRRCTNPRLPYLTGTAGENKGDRTRQNWMETNVCGLLHWERQGRSRVHVSRGCPETVHILARFP